MFVRVWSSPMFIWEYSKCSKQLRLFCWFSWIILLSRYVRWYVRKTISQSQPQLNENISSNQTMLAYPTSFDFKINFERQPFAFLLTLIDINLKLNIFFCCHTFHDSFSNLPLYFENRNKKKPSLEFIYIVMRCSNIKWTQNKA